MYDDTIISHSAERMILLSLTVEQLKDWKQKFPLLSDVIDLKPVFWLNPKLKKVTDIDGLAVSKSEMQEAEDLWHRFAPFLAIAFPETADAEGIIESPLKEISN